MSDDKLSVGRINHNTAYDPHVLSVDIKFYSTLLPIFAQPQLAI